VLLLEVLIYQGLAAPSKARLLVESRLACSALATLSSL